ncbi:ROK family protein [Lentilactobacillus senioris]|uniref:ROK family protein n=1 Tax=Lentilactobacillus senioris TaxID=931534 RepID=UPI00227E7C45|nr:ROK family protein [Lentilactobacillus senioris]MCY9806144.1 ROK family protein [Lentilactobacillus senioris]
MTANAILAIDIGGTSVKYGLWQDQKLSNKGSFSTPTTTTTMLTALKEVKNTLEQTAFTNIIGAAVSVPGCVNVTTGSISGISAVDYLNSIPFKDLLSRELNLPVSIQNDANCAALAEHVWGNAKDVNSAAFMIIGTGVGGAIIVNNQLFGGEANFAGEFGYAIMNSTGETLSQLGSPVKMAEKYNQLTDSSTNLTGKEVFTAADNGDQLARKCVNELYDTLSLAAYNLVVNFSPQRLVIGGGVSARQELITELNKRVNDLLKQNGTPLNIDVINCQFLNDANLVGAVCEYLNQKIKQ